MNIDTIDTIVSYLDFDDIKKLIFISKNIYNSIKLNNNLWSSICNKYFKLPGNYFQFRSLCNSTIYLQCITTTIKNTNYYKSNYIIEKNKKITIGRSRTNDICILYDESVSRKHCEFKFIDPTRIFIKDLNSFNKTSINGKKITVEQLYVGDEITIGGNVILKVVLV
tara:strand:- start:355 stop:855 length:501 start_codon:yes stop_codon:yes gene_type:complete